MEAVQRYDPYRGVKLSSYAVYWIRAYILKHIIDNHRLVRIGRSSRAERKLFFRLNKEKRELERQGFEAEPKLLAERLDVSEDDVVQMEQRMGGERPLAQRAGAPRRERFDRNRRHHADRTGSSAEEQSGRPGAPAGLPARRSVSSLRVAG